MDRDDRGEGLRYTTGRYLSASHLQSQIKTFSALLAVNP